MTKAEFIKRLEDQFQGMIESVKRNAHADIEGTRPRMDAQRFADWLRSEMDKANAEPALKAFDTVLRASHSTPHDAAHSLTALIEMDAAPDDWQTQWDSAAPLISNFYPKESDGWKYRRAFADYMAAMKAEARARLLSDFVEKTKGKDANNKTPAKPRIRVMALYLFYCNPDDRTKKGIMQVGKELGYNPSSFYNEWLNVERRDYRTEPQYMEDLRSVIKNLEADNKDTTAAIHDLNTTEGRVKGK
jgi:hypothetical protein